MKMSRSPASRSAGQLDFDFLVRLVQFGDSKTADLPGLGRFRPRRLGGGPALLSTSRKAGQLRTTDRPTAKPALPPILRLWAPASDTPPRCLRPALLWP